MISLMNQQGKEEDVNFDSSLAHQRQHRPIRIPKHPWPPLLALEGWKYCVEINENVNNIVLNEEVYHQRNVAVTTTTTTTRTSITATLCKQKQQQQTKVLVTLQKYSAIASWLCLIDCTILPILTLIVPLLGIANLGPDRLQFLHSIGDFTTLFILLPVGGLSTILNYILSTQRQHRYISFLGAIGLVLVALANSYSLPGLGHVQVFHFLHRGLWHRVVNAWGCGCLLVSNQWSLHYKHKHSVLKGNSKKMEDSCCVLHDKTKATNLLHGNSWHRHRRRRQFFLPAKSTNIDEFQGTTIV
jgi:hypothetical protein